MIKKINPSTIYVSKYNNVNIIIVDHRGGEVWGGFGREGDVSEKRSPAELVFLFVFWFAFSRAFLCFMNKKLKGEKGRKVRNTFLCLFTKN